MITFATLKAVCQHKGKPVLISQASNNKLLRSSNLTFSTLFARVMVLFHRIGLMFSINTRPCRRCPLYLAGSIVLLATACASNSTVRFSAVYLDLDGTALGSDHQVRMATVHALDRYRACGGHIGIATGRTLAQTSSYLPILRPDLPLVLFNGAVMAKATGNNATLIASLDQEAFLLAIRLIPSLPGVAGVIRHDLDATFIDRTTPEFDVFLQAAGIQPTRIVPDLAYASDSPVVKLLLFVPNGSLEPIRTRLLGVIADKSRVIVTSPQTVEITPVGVSKANAIRRGLVGTKLSPDDILTFGDSENDVEMLSEFGFGVAMGNCRPAACDAAIARIGRNDTDGIATVIRHLAISSSCSQE